MLLRLSLPSLRAVYIPWQVINGHGFRKKEIRKEGRK